MKRILSTVLSLALLCALALPAGAEPMAEEELSVTWLEGYNRLYMADGFLEAFKDGRWGVLEYNGDFHPWPEGVSSPYAMGREGPYVAEKDGKLGAVDRYGNIVVPVEYEDHDQVAVLAARTDSLARFGAAVDVRDGLYGVVDRDGNILLPYEYQSMTPFDADGLAEVRTQEGRGLVNAGGELVIPVGQADFFKAGEGLIALDNGAGLMGYVDHQGREVIPFRYQIQYGRFPTDRFGGTFVGGLAAVKRSDTGLWGYIDPKGNEIIPCQYEEAQDFSDDGFARVAHGGDHVLIDRRGDRVGTYVPGEWDYTEGLRVIHPGETYGYEDRAGSVVVPPLYYEAEEFRDGYALILKDGTYGLLKNPLKADVVSGWAADEVGRARDLGLVPARAAGYYTYDVTRLQFAELAVNLVEAATGRAVEPAESGRFSDTDDVQARKAAAAGIVNGTGDGTTFSPAAPITREELAAMLYRAEVYLCRERDGLGFTPAPLDPAPYRDADQISPWAEQAVGHLVNRGILKGTSADTLSPRGYTTVEQAILLVLRTYEQGGAEG